MLSIIGNGMNTYDLKNININLNEFDYIICDKNFDISNNQNNNFFKGGFKEVKEFILNNQNKNLAYIVSGSPLFYSGAIVILKYLTTPFKIIDNTSSKSYLLAKLGINESLVDTFSLHGKIKINLNVMFNKKYTFILCDEFSLNILKEALFYINKNDYIITLGAKFGYSDEVIKKIDINYILEKNLMPYVLLIEKKFEIKREFSLESEFFQDDGMITKRDKRRLSLFELELKENLLLWDIGAGTGSVGIDGYKNFKVKTLFFEKNPKRVEDIKQNITKHRVIDTTVIEGYAEINILKEDTKPDRIFIGGGGEAVINKLEYLYKILNINGIIVANFVTLKHLNKAITILEEANIKYKIKSISITNFKNSLLMSESERLMFYLRIEK